MLPNPLVVRAFTLRSTRLWLITRATASLFVVLAEGHPLRLSVGAVLLMVVLSVTVCFFETWRRRERALIGNLAMSSWVLASLFVLPPVLGEAVLFVLGSLFV
jgi:hypothetical protein